MALFTKKTKKTATPADASAVVVSGAARSLAHVLRQARITEKATMNETAGVYTFNVAPEATKRDVIRSIQALYKVTPRKINIVTVRTKSKRNARTGKVGVKGGGKKAYVYLKKDETITIG